MEIPFVEACNPKLVYTMHGFEKEFAFAIQRKLGIQAKPLSTAGQKLLAEFS